jgi:hypothetical protein
MVFIKWVIRNTAISNMCVEICVVNPEGKRRMGENDTCKSCAYLTLKVAMITRMTFSLIADFAISTKCGIKSYFL